MNLTELSSFLLSFSNTILGAACTSQKIEGGTNSCDAALAFLSEAEKTGNASEFAPYLKYLQSSEVPSIPSTWSPDGKSLLKTIQGPNLYPKDISESSFLEDCVDDEYEDLISGMNDDKKAKFESAYAIALTRSWDEKLVPLLDMINHSPNFNIGKKTIKDDDGRPQYIVVFSTRNIRKGQQLYTSYRNRNRDRTHHAGTLFENFGFVEDFPQRWKLPTPQRRSNVEANQIPADITFEVFKVTTEKEEVDEYEIEWERPSEGVSHPAAVDFLKEELSRIQGITAFVEQTAASLSSNSEREAILDYHWSMVIAYETVIADIEEAIEDSSATPMDYEGDNFMACADFEALHEETYGWKFSHSSYSNHQDIDYYYNSMTRDACLFLDEYLHACVSNRPHYHEVFVHYPAYFLDKVERVLFIGGGDSMVLHEALKYADLELVVGLELDQQVVRSTFAKIGTQPHFDNDKVEWWFGDAAEALNILPTDYYGTFDLVVVDILSVVAENLEVTDDVTIMEAALMLLKPDGIIVKNEDEGYVPGSTKLTKFTDYTVDVMYYDVPVYCLQTFVIGSNTVNFATATPKDHNISNFYLKSVDEFQAQFDTWYTTNGKEIEGGGHDRYDKEEQAKKSNTIGMVMIIDADKISIPISMTSASSIQQTINKSIETVGFTVDRSIAEDMLAGYILISVLREGVVSARCFPENKYCAIDVQLWKSAHLAESLKQELFSALGTQENSVYRVVTAGVEGLEEDNNNDKIGPPPKNAATPADDNADSESVPGTVFQQREDPTINFKNATFEDYDSVSGLEQWYSQEPLAHQSIVKFEVPLEAQAERFKIRITDLLKETLVDTLEHFQDTSEDQISVETNLIGDGFVTIGTWSEGSIVGVWDGAMRLDINIFTLERSGKPCQKNLGMALSMQLENKSVDAFPRGTSRVLNFRAEFTSSKTGKRIRPFWAPPTEDDEEEEE